MSGVSKIKQLNDVLESQNDMIEQYTARERADRDVKVTLYQRLARVSAALNEAPSGVEILQFPTMRTEDLAKMQPSEITEAIAKWAHVASNCIHDSRKELGELYEALGMSQIDDNLERFNRLRTQANQAGIAANFRGIDPKKTIPVRPKTPEETLDATSAASFGPVPVPSPPESTGSPATKREEGPKKQAPSKTTTLENLLGAKGAAKNTPKKK